MTVDLEKAANPIRKLRKQLKKFPADPTPDQVHSLRTHARRLEAIVHALSPEASKSMRRAVKLLKPVRRSAGAVRDMDVLISKLASLGAHATEDGTIRLVENLAAMRMKRVRRLRRVLKTRSREARQHLKHCLRTLERDRTAGSPLLAESPAPAQIVAAALEHWPKLHGENLHEFRKQVKELRYMLQVTPEKNEELLEAFARVKDTAGEWHDWLELQHLAESILEPASDAALLRDIRENMREKLRVALTTANALRKRGFEMPLAA